MIGDLVAGAGAAVALVGIYWCRGHTGGLMRALMPQPGDTPRAERSAALLVCIAGGLICISGAQTRSDVVERMEWRTISHTPGRLVGEIWGDKVRDCELMPGTMRVQVLRRDGAGFKSGYRWPGDPSPGSSRVTGWQSFGVWDLTYAPAAEPVVAVVAAGRHDCGRGLLAVPTRVEMAIGD